MGLILCSKHGQSGFAARISKGVCDRLKAGTLTADDQLRLFTIRIFLDGEPYIDIRYLLEANEAKQLNLPELVDVTTDEECDAYLSRLPELGGICVRCLDDYKRKYGMSLLNFF